LLGRCLCKRVDVYIITLSCTWRIYALSERLLVDVETFLNDFLLQVYKLCSNSVTNWQRWLSLLVNQLLNVTRVFNVVLMPFQILSSIAVK